MLSSFGVVSATTQAMLDRAYGNVGTRAESGAFAAWLAFSQSVFPPRNSTLPSLMAARASSGLSKNLNVASSTDDASTEDAVVSFTTPTVLPFKLSGVPSFPAGASTLTPPIANGSV